MKDDSRIKGWTFLTGDRDWSGVDATWCKQAKDGSWFVLRFENMREYDSGAVDRGEWEEFSCEVKRVDFSDIPQTEIDSALRSCGYIRRVDGTSKSAIVNEYDGEYIAEDPNTVKLVLLDCCVSYGLGAPLHTETGNKHPIQVRGRARRVAEEMMRDVAKLEAALDRPVNRIGSTAREYGRGDISSAMDRHRTAREPQVTFGTLNPDGSLTNVRHIKHSDLRKCRFTIFNPEHYRDDGSCRCDDEAERARLIESCGYTNEDFNGIQLRAQA